MQPETLPKLPFSQSYWVIPGKFLAGEHPAGSNELATTQRVRALIQVGVSVFYDLSENIDGRVRYANILYREAEAVERIVNYRPFPIQDFTAPSVETVKTVLNSIDQSLTNQKMIYVHCYAGIGRTGTIVGCFLARHGMSGQNALNQIAELRQGLSSWYRHSPEVQDQIELVLNWPAGA